MGYRYSLDCPICGKNHTVRTISILGCIEVAKVPCADCRANPPEMDWNVVRDIGAIVLFVLLIAFVVFVTGCAMPL